jgi:hypothetical protein
MKTRVGSHAPLITILVVVLFTGIDCGRPQTTESGTVSSVSGGIDLVASAKAGGIKGTVKKGEMAKAEGWCLVKGMTPALVTLMVDGRKVGETANFAGRADVNEFFKRDVGSCAWRIDFPTEGLTPGDHRVEITASQAVAQPGLLFGHATKMRVIE